jgi:hypothetical protein
MNTIGTNIFVEVLKNTPLKKDEVMNLFKPLDFEPVCVKEKITSILLSSSTSEHYQGRKCLVSHCMNCINCKFREECE